jgi:hypothetical protein
MSTESTPLLQNAQNGYSTPNSMLEVASDSAIEQQLAPGQDPPEKSHLVFVRTKFLNLSLG